MNQRAGNDLLTLKPCSWELNVFSIMSENYCWQESWHIIKVHAIVLFPQRWQVSAINKSGHLCWLSNTMSVATMSPVVDSICVQHRYLLSHIITISVHFLISFLSFQKYLPPSKIPNSQDKKSPVGNADKDKVLCLCICICVLVFVY